MFAEVDFINAEFKKQPKCINFIMATVFHNSEFSQIRRAMSDIAKVLTGSGRGKFSISKWRVSGADKSLINLINKYLKQNGIYCCKVGAGTRTASVYVHVHPEGFLLFNV